MKRFITITMIALAAVPSQAKDNKGQSMVDPRVFTRREIASTLGFGPTAGSDSRSGLQAPSLDQVASLLCIRAH